MLFCSRNLFVLISHDVDAEMYDALFVMYCHCSVGEEIQSVFNEYYLKIMLMR